MSPARAEPALAGPLQPPPAGWDRRGLPGWTYFSEELLDLERDRIFRSHWQFACHVNDVADPGDFCTFDIAGERALIIRGHDGALRTFHNLCRHRGSRVVAEQRGSCRHSLVCPFHGWTYNLDGTLRGASRSDTFPPLDGRRWGLKPIEMEVWNGLVFVRFRPGPQSPVRDIMNGVEAEIEPYGVGELVPAESGSYEDELGVNWKSVRDVDNEGYHVRQAHPGLHDLYGDGYFDEPYANGVARSVGPFNTGPPRLWSVQAYRNILPDITWLPEPYRRLWLYVGMFPNLVFGFYPDCVIYYQEIPLSATRTIQRGGVYRRASESRQLRLARYLSGRIDRDAVEEDRMLAVWSCEAANSSAYDGILMSDLEYGMRSFHDHLRMLVPAINEPDQPAAGTLRAVNDRLLAGAAA